MQNPMVSPMLSRRQALQRLAHAAAIVAVLPAPHALSAEAQPAGGAAHLDVKDPAATALGYVENAANVDPKKYPIYAQGSSCENCLQLQGAAGASYRPCSLFPGKLVAVAGWCSGWTAEM